ncbi:hypothetical protein [Sphingomonas sp. KR3-1]|uniref:hypothetical protein n=1 Tax=Sphingomonas sp. KR3-1 TaxID=3156611 RepID=UPI0032B5C5FB
MERPRPIIWFSRYYLTALALKTLGTLADWTHANAAALQIGLIVALLLWFGVVHRRSNVARWILLLAYAPSLALAILGIAGGGYIPLTVLFYIASLVFFSAAIVQLVRNRVDGWFAKTPPSPDA